MPKLTHIIEKAKHHVSGVIERQRLELSVVVDNKGEFNYEDVKAELFIDGKRIAEISGLLTTAKVFEPIVDAVDWKYLHYQYKETHSLTSNEAI